MGWCELFCHPPFIVTSYVKILFLFCLVTTCIKRNKEFLRRKLKEFLRRKLKLKWSTKVHVILTKLIPLNISTRFVDLYLQGLSRVTTHTWLATKRFMLEKFPPVLRPFLSKISNTQHHALLHKGLFYERPIKSDCNKTSSLETINDVCVILMLDIKNKLKEGYVHDKGQRPSVNHRS